jgi:NAD(P)-dependent dehydrogenase (short-subunit alcohol dehydrogenase family)
MDAAAARGSERFGTIHIVVDNAGIPPAMPFEEMTIDDLRRIKRVDAEAR